MSDILFIDFVKNSSPYKVIATMSDISLSFSDVLFNKFFAPLREPKRKL